MVPRIEWSDEARADIRRLDRPTAMRVFDCLLRFARSGEGDLKRLQGDLAGRLRLRVGDYRVLLTRSAGGLRVHAVKHRSDVYRQGGLARFGILREGSTVRECFASYPEPGQKRLINPEGWC